jgi:hypothetical protein
VSNSAAARCANNGCASKILQSICNH